MEEEVFFVCTKYPELSITMVSGETARDSPTGRKILARHINFLRKPCGGAWRGEFKTNKQDEIDFLRSHFYYVQKVIIETKDPDSVEGGEPVMGLVAGTVDSGQKQTAALAPEDLVAKPRQAAVAPTLKRGRGRPRKQPVSVV